MLEGVLARAPEHPGANHFYIHAVEASPDPGRGTAAADRLSRLVPGAGHLVHMPSHIYIRTGRYHDGSEANARAIASDHDDITQCRQQGIYPVAYHPHNHHMLWATASFEGRREASMKAARETAAHVDAALFDVPGVGGAQQHFRTIPYFGMVRFGLWDEMLAEPSPGETAYPRGVWHYGRGMAYAARGELEAARAKLEALGALVADEALEQVRIWEINSVRTILGIAHGVLKRELAFRSGDFDRAIDHLEQAASVEAELAYGEPPDWFYPVRHILGDVLLEAGRPGDAERVYRDDLASFPANGWSLAGLARALRSQGRDGEAAVVEAEFEEAWQWADVEIERSRI